MTRQIAERLTDHVVTELDELVADGRAESRTAVVTSAVERELRRLLAERDAEILRECGPQDDLDPLVSWTMQQLGEDGQSASE